MKIYTRTGDDGSTSLFSGERIPKTHPRIDICGAIDELNSALGMARASTSHQFVCDRLEKIQYQIFELCADLATSAAATHENVRIKAGNVEWLEEEIDKMMVHLPVLKNFVLPGGTLTGAQIHFARTICRRAERQIVHLAQNEQIHDTPIAYLNRLSDFLFTLARFENLLSDAVEKKWVPS